ncbi:30S ribosomal protein S7 [Candidatus Micrarchaeota archaeon]|jgi:small subunit ribosomal protein S7|nr:30S ribosomal protein S7 [Candidatus Micrarchaeota archaeon]
MVDLSKSFLLFGKYSFDGIEVVDPSLKPYIDLNPIYMPHSAGRHVKKQLGKANVNIVERLINKLMRGGTGDKISGKVIRTKGRLQGKKQKVSEVVKNAFDIVHTRTKQNPIQVLVKAIENSAPCEDVTRVSMGGVSYQVAVDISATRRLDLALRNIALASLMGCFNKKKTLAQALADEIMFTADGDIQKSYAVKKKNEIERMARSAR